jgi:hypothetical protein
VLFRRQFATHLNEIYGVSVGGPKGNQPIQALDAKCSIRARCGRDAHYLDVECRYASFDDCYLHMLGLGYSPLLSIDRNDPFGHYERANVRLVPHEDQNRNKRVHHRRRDSATDAGL